MNSLTLNKIKNRESGSPYGCVVGDPDVDGFVKGVFVCHCGINIGGVVDVPRVVEYAKTLPAVVCAEENLYACSSEGLSRIKEAIRKYDFNRVVVASCTPRTHEPLFRTACEEAGLNKYLFQMANIREHCSWVHMHESGRLRLEWASAGEGKRLPGS